MMKRIGALGAVSALVGALMFVGVSSASAHVPSLSATCNGVTVSGANYDAGDTNTLSVSVSGGGSDSKAFGTSGSASASVPQDGVTHTYTAYVHTTASDPSYSHEYSGTVGPCGKPAKPADKVEWRQVVDDPNCTDHTVTTEHQSRTIPYVWADAKWVPGTPTPWHTVRTTSRATTHDDCCPKGDQPPADTETRDVVDGPDCTVLTVTTEHQSRTRAYTFDDKTWSWIPGAWSDWHTDSSSSAPATLEQCPPPVQPKALSSAVPRSHQKCGDDFTTTVTTTTTTDYVLDEATRTWSLGDPVVTETTDKVPAKVFDCVTAVKPVADPVAALPDTGGPSMLIGLAGVLLLGLGSIVLWFQLRRTTADE